MVAADDAYGGLIRIDPAGAGEESLRRIPVGTPKSQGGMDESTLQDLLFQHPKSLPVASIDAAYDGAVPVCKELSTPAGYLDALYVNALGRLTLVEFKLWRNPQARRQVIGQILDYAKELASWRYEDLQREVSKRLNKTGNALYDQVCAIHPDVNEAQFVDNVNQHLQRGEFLLLIVGDGIREGVETIVDFVQRHSGLRFNLALVEVALYRENNGGIIVQPRILVRTEIVSRFVYETEDTRDMLPEESERDDVLSDLQQENLQFWKAVLEDYSFSDVTVEIPDQTTEATLYVKVRNSGHGDWGLSFDGYLYRKNPTMGCYFTCRRGIPHAVRVYKEIQESMDELRRKIGSDLETWENRHGNPRIGFRRREKLPFGVAYDSPDFQESLRWMRERLDRLVSTLHPLLQRKLSAG